MPITDKQTLRASLLRDRSALDAEQVARKSTAVLANLRSMPAWSSAKQVLTYMPIRGEVDTALLLQEMWDRGVRVLLPRCRPREDGVMDVACATCLDDLAPGKYGILEPDPDVCPGIEKAAPDLILIPGVGFDRNGYRIGFGAGFYDRFLSGKDAPDATLYGLAYDFQLVEAIPADKWDVPVHAVITENEIICP